MCETCGNLNHKTGLAAPERRKLLFAGAGLAAAPLVAGMASAASAQAPEPVVDLGASRVRGYGVANQSAPFEAIEIPRRAVRDNDVLIEVLYCGICHSDIHIARNE